MGQDYVSAPIQSPPARAELASLAGADLCIVTIAGADGGVEKCDRELAMHAVRQGRRAVIVATGRDFFTGRLAGLHIPVLCDLRDGDRKPSVGNLRQAVRFFRALRPRAVVFDHTSVLSFTTMMLAARLADVPRVVSIIYNNITSPPPTAHRRYLAGLVPGIGWWWHKQRLGIAASLRANDRVLFATHEHAGRFARHYRLSPRAWAVVPHLGADVEVFRPLPDQSQAVRKTWGLTDADPVIGYVGRLGREKGPDVLLRALARLNGGAAGGRPHCIIAGDGPLRDELEKLTADLGIQQRVRFLGRVEQPAAVMAAADVIVVPSREECFGLVLVEAMATARPVVSASVGGMREIVTPDRDGLVFPSEDHVALAGQIGRLLGDPALGRSIGQQARQTVCQRYSKAQVLAQIDAVLGLRDDVAVPAPRRAAPCVQ